MTQSEAKRHAQTAVLNLIRRVAEVAEPRDAMNNGANIGKLFDGCAAVLRAMDEITVIDE
jgi:hypothetical protein